jgi:DNA invertase Pin-like site-specific DNA recombinase
MFDGSLKMVAVAITRLEHGAADLRLRATRMSDADAVRRLLAIALLLEGSSREAAARATGMDRQTLRDWVHRYNAQGPSVVWCRDVVVALADGVR